MISLNRKVFFPAVLLLLFSCFVVLGQERPTITVTPLRVMARVAPGQAYNGTIQVTNTGDQATSISISLNDFMLNEDGAFITLDPETMGDRSLAGYIDFSPDRITLEPGESQEVRYSFTLPMDATGPHWAALIVTPETSTEASTQFEEEGIALIIHYKFNFAVAIIERPLHPVTPAGQMTAMEVSGSTTEDGKEILTVRPTFENLCEDVLRCNFYIEVRDEQGETVLRYDSPPDLLVFPESQRVFSHSFTDVDMPAAKYMVLCVVDFGGEHLVGAQYMATVGEES